MTTLRTLAAVALGLLLGVPGPARAQNIFRGVDSTVGGYSTWDSDLINIEAVPQTGAGVYVAVLDTGLVPNWNDYIPTARVATQYGAGFDPQVTFKPHSTGCEFDVEAGPVKQSTNFNGSRSSSHGTH